MTRQKKTRKTGPIAARKLPKDEWKKKVVESNKKPVKYKGLPPGSRFNEKLNAPHAGQQTGATLNDPRHGSKKPIALIMPGKSNKQKAGKLNVVDLTPAEELALLENDERLQDFLDALDDGETLHAEDQAWVDQQLARFQQLAEILGLDLDDEDEEDEGGAPLWCYGLQVVLAG